MEKFSHNLLSLDRFLLRVWRFFFRAMSLLFLGLIPGVIGFMLTENHSLSDAALNAISMVGSQGVNTMPSSTAGKYFIAVYGFFLQAIFFVALGVFISPLVHRMIHRWHLDNTENN